MPLPEPHAEREHLHTRQVECRGFRRADGLWDIEGHITDVKSYAFASHDRSSIAPEEPVHDMWIRLTLDDELEVKAVAAVTDQAPFTICPAITPNFERLVGLRIGPGWNRAVKQRLGGMEGCTHLVELLGPVATTAFQTIVPVISRERAEARRAEGRPERDPMARPSLLDTCHAFRSDGPVVERLWPEHYTGGTAREGEAAPLNPATGGAARATDPAAP